MKMGRINSVSLILENLVPTDRRDYRHSGEGQNPEIETTGHRLSPVSSEYFTSFL